jgi:hypothetical protein
VKTDLARKAFTIMAWPARVISADDTVHGNAGDLQSVRTDYDALMMRRARH